MKKVTNNLTLPVLVEWMKHYTAVSSQDHRIKLIAERCKNEKDPVYCVYKSILEKVDYKRDPVTEEGQIHKLKGASAAFRKGHGNCHTYAILNAAVLLQMGYRPAWRFYSFSGDAWDHVVTLVKGKVLDQSVMEGKGKASARKMYNVAPPVYEDTKDIKLSKLLLLQGRNNPDYYQKDSVNRERAQRLGMNQVGVQGNSDIEKRIVDGVRQKWLVKFNHWFGNPGWIKPADKIDNVQEKGVDGFLKGFVQWHLDAAKGYDVSDQTQLNASERIEANLSKFVANTIVAEFQKGNWEQAIRGLKEKVVIPTSFKNIKEEGNNSWEKDLKNAARWFVGTYFDHVDERSDRPASGLVYPELYTRGNFGSNAFEVIKNRFDYLIDDWADNYKKDGAMPSFVKKNVSNQKAKQVANQAVKQLPIKVTEQTSARSETEKKASGPIGLGLGAGLMALKAFL